MDWNDTNHLLQALLVSGCVFAFLHGYRSGDKL